MVVSEAHGLPVAFLVSPHSTHESQLAPTTVLPLAQIRIPKQGAGRPLNYRALVVRYDRKAAHYRAYVVLSAILLCLKRLLTPA